LPDWNPDSCEYLLINNSTIYILCDYIFIILSSCLCRW